MQKPESVYDSGLAKKMTSGAYYYTVTHQGLASLIKAKTGFEARPIVHTQIVSREYRDSRLADAP
jgi:hypothetical protein